MGFHSTPRTPVADEFINVRDSWHLLDFSERDKRGMESYRPVEKLFIVFILYPVCPEYEMRHGGLVRKGEEPFLTLLLMVSCFFVIRGLYTKNS